MSLEHGTIPAVMGMVPADRFLLARGTAVFYVSEDGNREHALIAEVLDASTGLVEVQIEELRAGNFSRRYTTQSVHSVNGEPFTWHYKGEIANAQQ